MIKNKEDLKIVYSQCEILKRQLSSLMNSIHYVDYTTNDFYDMVDNQEVHILNNSLENFRNLCMTFSREVELTLTMDVNAESAFQNDTSAREL